MSSLPLPVHVGAEARIAFLMALRAKGLRDTSILRAFETVPRGRFVPRRFIDLALTDVALPIACGQTTLAPSQMAEVLVALGSATRAPGAGDRIRLGLRHGDPGAAGG